MHWQPLCTAGRFTAFTEDEPGVHGVTMAGAQGALAPGGKAATAGLAGDRHWPNGRIFVPDSWSVTVATARPPALTPRVVGMSSALGADPIVHWSRAPDVTRVAMVRLSSGRW